MPVSHVSTTSALALLLFSCGSTAALAFWLYTRLERRHRSAWPPRLGAPLLVAHEGPYRSTVVTPLRTGIAPLGVRAASVSAIVLAAAGLLWLGYLGSFLVEAGVTGAPAALTPASAVARVGVIVGGLTMGLVTLVCVGAIAWAVPAWLRRDRRSQAFATCVTLALTVLGLVSVIAHEHMFHQHAVAGALHSAGLSLMAFPLAALVEAFVVLFTAESFVADER